MGQTNDIEKSVIKQDFFAIFATCYCPMCIGRCGGSEIRKKLKKIIKLYTFS